MKKSFLISLVFLYGVFICPSYAVEVTLFGPEKYIREEGKPYVFSANFPGRYGTGALIIKNGTFEGTSRISSAIILINGQQILGPDSFNLEVYDIEVPIYLKENNTISIELRSKVGSYLTIEINQEIDADGAGVIGINGGSIKVKDVSSPYYGIELYVPPGALNEEVVLSINDPSFFPPAPEGYVSGDNPIELKPSGLFSNKSIKLVIPSNGLSDRIFYVFNDIEDMWFSLDTILNYDTQSFIVTTRHFSIFNWFCGSMGNTCRTFDPFTNVKYKVNINSNNIIDSTEEQIKDAIQLAFTKWENALNGRLIFEETQDVEADISFFWGTSPYFEPPFGDPDALGRRIADPFGHHFIVFNDTYIWHADPGNITSYVSVKSVALHEIGHALGLAHFCPEGDECGQCQDGPVMATTYILSDRNFLLVIDTDSSQFSAISDC